MSKTKQVVDAVDSAVSVAKAVNANAVYKHKDKVELGLEVAAKLIQLVRLVK